MREALSGVNWFDLGIQLGLKHSRLRDIEIENPRNVSRCKIDMIAAWLKKKDDVAKKGGPTCKQLAEALRVIGEIGLSEEIGEIMKQKLSSPVVKSTKEKSRRDLSTDEKRSAKKRKKKMKKRKSSDTDSDNERGETHRYMYKKRKIESESDSSDNDDEKEEKSSKVKRKRIESSFDSHESKKSRLESSDDDEKSVSSKVQGKGPASGKPYKRKRVPKNKTDSESDDDSDSEPSSKRR